MSILKDPRNGLPFYVGKGTGNRAYQHAKFKDRNNNPYKDNKIRNILDSGNRVIVEFAHKNLEESVAYFFEEELIKQIGLDFLTNMTSDSKPPSRTGKHLSEETLKKRSASLKGIPRTDEWRENLSKSKQGKNNGMFGRKNPCSKDKRLSIIRTKNEVHYDLYKQALILLRSGISASQVARELGISKGPCCKLANGSHAIFEAFPELREFKTC